MYSGGLGVEVDLSSTVHCTTPTFAVGGSDFDLFCVIQFVQTISDSQSDSKNKMPNMFSFNFSLCFPNLIISVPSTSGIFFLKMLYSKLNIDFYGCLKNKELYAVFRSDGIFWTSAPQKKLDPKTTVC